MKNNLSGVVEPDKKRPSVYVKATCAVHQQTLSTLDMKLTEF